MNVKQHRRKWQPPGQGSGVLTIEEQWKDYAAAIFDPPERFGEIQKQETRQAFYAGAIAMFFTITGDLTDLSDDEAGSRLTAYRREIDEYGMAQKLRAERAAPTRPTV